MSVRPAFVNVPVRRGQEPTFPPACPAHTPCGRELPWRRKGRRSSQAPSFRGRAEKPHASEPAGATERLLAVIRTQSIEIPERFD